MAETVISSPSIKQIEDAINAEAQKPNPNLKVMRELLDMSRGVLSSAGVNPAGPPTLQERVSEEVRAEPTYKQALIGAGTVLPRAAQGLRGIFGEVPKQEIEELKMVRGATPASSLGAMGGDIALGASLPTRGLNAIPGVAKTIPALLSRPGQIADLMATSAITQAAIAPEDKGTAAAFGAGAGALPAVFGSVQRALPQSAGGVSRPQIAGEKLLRDFGSDAENVIKQLKQEYNLVPGVSGTSAVVTQNPYLQTLETGSRVGNPQLWMPLDQSNAAARYAALLKMSGTKAERDALIEARTVATAGPRQEAFEAVRTIEGMTRQRTLDPLRQSLDALARGEQRENPAVQKVVQYVANAMDNPAGITPEQMYTVRKILTGQIKTGANDDLGAAAAAARRDTIGIVKGIDDSLDNLSGGMWTDYLKTYGAASRDLNSKQALQDVLDRISKGHAEGRVPSSLSGQTGELTLGRAADDLTRQQFGSKNVDLLVPETRQSLEQMKQDLMRTAQAMNARATGGSPTATYQAARGQANDLASQLAGYTGAAAGSVVGGNLGAAVGSAAGRGMTGEAAKKNAEILARLLQNPEYMAEMLRKAQQSQLLLDISKRLGTGSAGAASSYKAQPGS
tara:strand:+ start:3502 stop:5370 length:1869 start_codon:yes stop_codon:yes gene_type:complete